MRALGGALRQAREEGGYSLREFAAKLDRAPAVLSRWETGDRTPKPEQVAQILSMLDIKGDQFDAIVSLAYNVDEPRWAAATLPEQRQQGTAVVDAEQSATRITVAAPLLVPGLLQISDYVHAIMTAGGIPPGEVATRVAVRIGRGDVLTRSKNPAEFVAFIGETALQVVIGSRATMADQLRYLLKMSERSNVTLCVVPCDAGWHPALEGAFTIIESEPAIKVVHVENRRSGQFFHEDDDVSAYVDAVETVRKVSLSPPQSGKLITKYIVKLERCG